MKAFLRTGKIHDVNTRSGDLAFGRLMPGTRPLHLFASSVDGFKISYPLQTYVHNGNSFNMAPKEATIYIIDVGKSTGECHNGRSQSDLDYGMNYIWDKLTTAMAAGLKGVGIGIIGLRTDDTDNPLSNGDEDAYDNLSIWKPLGMMEMPHLRELKQHVKPSNTNDGDAVSAIVLAVNKIEEFTMLKSGKPGKFNRHIVLLTNGKGHMDGDGIDQIAEEINRHEIQLTIM